MGDLIKEFFKWPLVTRLRTPDNDDEHIDRLNHRVTVGLILCGVFIATTSPFVTNRISCWIPAELKHASYPKYIEHYCYISNTYYIHSNVTPPNSEDDRKSAQIGMRIIFFETNKLFYHFQRLLSMGTVSFTINGLMFLCSSIILAFI